jgi:hypothetical protein
MRRALCSKHGRRSCSMARRYRSCQGRVHIPILLLYSTEVTIQAPGKVSMCQKPRVRGRRQRRCRYDVLLPAKDDILSFYSSCDRDAIIAKTWAYKFLYRHILDGASRKPVFGFSQAREMTPRCLICIITTCNSKDEEATQWLQILKETPQATVWQTCVSRG